MFVATVTKKGKGNDNLRSDCEYTFLIKEEPTLKSRIWFYKNNEIYYSAPIFKITGNIYHSRNCKYKIERKE